MWRKGAGAEASLAANAFLFINHDDIPVAKVGLEGIYRAYCHAGGLHAVPALGEEDVVRPFSKTILHDLYS